MGASCQFLVLALLLLPLPRAHAGFYYDVNGGVTINYYGVYDFGTHTGLAGPYDAPTDVPPAVFVVDPATGAEMMGIYDYTLQSETYHGTECQCHDCVAARASQGG